MHFKEIFVTYMSFFKLRNKKLTTICLLRFKNCLFVFPLLFLDCLFKIKQKIVQEVMQEWVLRVGDANVKQKIKKAWSRACLLGSQLANQLALIAL